jgi:hypothetical protein
MDAENLRSLLENLELKEGLLLFWLGGRRAFVGRRGSCFFSRKNCLFDMGQRGV